MNTVMPQSELVRKALVYIDATLQERPASSLHQLLDEAGARFNLSPLECETLLAVFKEAQARKS